MSVVMRIFLDLLLCIMHIVAGSLVIWHFDCNLPRSNSFACLWTMSPIFATDSGA